MIVPPDDPADLELPPEVMRAMGQAVLERVVDFITSLSNQGACGDIHAEELCRALRERAPEHGVPISELLDPLFHDWIPRSFNTAGPGYLAYIPGGGIFPAALADLIAGGTNRYTGIWLAAPALVQLEANVLDWFRDWMGFPSTTRGLFTTGGSMSVFNAVLCARERQLGTEIRSGVLYTSNQAHAAVVKSAKLAGIFPDRVRLVSVDSQFRMRFDDLGDQIARDRRAGCGRFWSCRRRGRRTPAPLIRWTQSPISANARDCGTTSTAPMVRFSIWSSRCAHFWQVCHGPTR